MVVRRAEKSSDTFEEPKVAAHTRTRRTLASPSRLVEFAFDLHCSFNSARSNITSLRAHLYLSEVLPRACLRQLCVPKADSPASSGSKKHTNKIKLIERARRAPKLGMYELCRSNDLELAF